MPYHCVCLCGGDALDIGGVVVLSWIFKSTPSDPRTECKDVLAVPLLGRNG